MKTETHDLVTLAKSGDEKAYTELYNRFYRQVFAYYCKSGHLKDEDTAQELIQITLVKSLCNIDKYQPTHQFGVWVMRIAKNKLINFARSKKAQKNDTLYIDFSLMPSKLEPSIRLSGMPADPAKLLETAETFDAIHNAINQLDFRLSQPLNMHYFEGRQYDEIAEILQIPSGTCKARIHHAKRQLRELLQNI